MKENSDIIERIPSLDGIRGLTFLFVFFNHTMVISSSWNTDLRGSGKIGVWLFFILSSFLLTHYFISEPEKTKKPIEWINYLVRRFLRIYPLYVIVICIYYIFYILYKHNRFNNVKATFDFTTRSSIFLDNAC